MVSIMSPFLAVWQSIGDMTASGHGIPYTEAMA